MQLTKRKKSKTLVILLACLLGVSTLSACTNENPTSFRAYWTADATLPESLGFSERLEYDVTFTAGTSSLANYSVNYLNGKYETALTTKQVEGSSEIIYVYETKLTMDVVYTYKTESTTPLKDSVTTRVEFRNADELLQPISSHKEFVCHSPMSSAASLEDCYQKYDYVIDTTYEGKKGATSVTSYLLDDETGERLINSDGTFAIGEGTSYKKNFTINDKKNAYLDNEQLLFAIRGIEANSSTSEKILVYSPLTAAMQTINVSFSSSKSEEFTFNRNGVDSKNSIEYYPVSLSISSKNPGATQTAWIAKKNASGENVHRNLMLRLITPLSYGLGSLTYSLTSATISV